MSEGGSQGHDAESGTTDASDIGHDGAKWLLDAYRGGKSRNRARAADTSDQRGTTVTNDSSGQRPDQPRDRVTADYSNGATDTFENKGIEFILQASQPEIYQPDSEGGMPPAESAAAAPAPPTSEAPPDSGTSGSPETSN